MSAGKYDTACTAHVPHRFSDNPQSYTYLSVQGTDCEQHELLSYVAQLPHPRLLEQTDRHNERNQKADVTCLPLRYRELNKENLLFR